MIAFPRVLLVMPGQKREARLRADDPGIHQNKMRLFLISDGLPGQARQ
jgi:hypothetical protein